MPSGEEIQRALTAFVAKWADYSGTEKSEAQTYLNELFACYGSDRREVGAKFEFWASSAGFMDLHWPGVCLIEMKAPGVRVATAQAQVERYWRASSDPDTDREAARWVVICNFHEFQIWEPGRFPTRPRAAFTLAELPERYDALSFLAGPSVEPNFTEHFLELTKEAAKLVTEAYQALVDRSAAPAPVLQRFVLQSVWCMFAEDLGMLDGFPFQATLTELRSHPERSAAELGHLFKVLNEVGDHNRVGRLRGTCYVNGDLFRQPADIGLTCDEIDLLRRATRQDWRKVDPTIFGSLMEGVLGRRLRWERGAHYTHEVDIMKIVTPTIIRPWRARIEATGTPKRAFSLLEELCRFRVLDPACGCGNFLYVAYRELRGLEHELKERIRSLARDQGVPEPAAPWPYYPLRNLQGIDIEAASVQITRVTLWMGQRQMIELYGEAEPALPLQDLSGIMHADALQTRWPETDCIIGNPPFLGSQHIRHALNDEYVDWLKREFGVGVKDLCTYWFRKAADHLQPGQRAGLVGTNSISQNRGRSASLEYVEARGGVITDAVSSQKWPGEAKVHVSIVNWVDEPTEPVITFLLDGIDVPGINASLQAALPGSWVPRKLKQNGGRCFQGPIPVGAGFIIASNEAQDMLRDDTVDYARVVRPYLTGEDIAYRPDQSGSRWIIDFAAMPLETAQRYPLALQILRDRVKPERDQNARPSRRRLWWQLGERAMGMRRALASRERWIASNRVGKRFLPSWQQNPTLPSDKAQVFSFDDDFSMALLLSRAHGAWAWHTSSTLKADLNYTPSSAFMTFAWPDPVAAEQRERVADASRRLLARRTEICMTEQIGLTKLYNAVDDGAWTDLKALHRQLDEAVVECYGWPTRIAQDDVELVQRLTLLNREIAEGGRAYAPFD